MRLWVIAIGLSLVLSGGTVHARGGNEPLTLGGRVIEGGLVWGATDPGAHVTIAGRKLRVNDQGYFVFGLGRDAPTKVRLLVNLPDGRRINRVLMVKQRKYRIQRIKGLPKAKVTPPPEASACEVAIPCSVPMYCRNSLQVRRPSRTASWGRCAPTVHCRFPMRRRCPGRPTSSPRRGRPCRATCS